MRVLVTARGKRPEELKDIEHIIETRDYRHPEFDQISLRTFVDDVGARMTHVYVSKDVLAITLIPQAAR